MHTNPPSASVARLDGWKEIAAYLNRSVRTAERWARLEALPVHRLQHDKGNSVFAFTQELDQWKSHHSLALNESSPSSSAPRLLVLPFVNLTGNPGQQHLTDSLTEDTITALANLAPDRLAVLARTTSLACQRSRRDVAQLARSLSLDYVVEGSFRLADGRLHATVQLIQAHGQTHLAAQRHEFSQEELPALSSRIAVGLAPYLPVPALPEDIRSRVVTSSLEAYRHYSEGRAAMREWAPASVALARQRLEQAVQIDPEFALAFDALAELHWFLGFFGYVPPRETFPLGLWAALRAIEIDPDLPDTHALLGLYWKELAFNWAEVRREMAIAARLNPHSPLVRFRRAIGLLLPHGQLLEASRELEAILELDPLSTLLRFWLSTLLWFQRRIDEAVQQARRILEYEPESHLGHMTLGVLLSAVGRHAEAIHALRHAVEITGGAPLMQGWLALALASGGDAPAARQVLAQLQQIASVAYVPPSSLAWGRLALGDLDQGFDALQRAFEARDPMAIPLRFYPFLDPVAQDPRFQALLAQIGPGSAPA